MPKSPGLSSQDVKLAESLGLQPGVYATVRKFGANPSISANSLEDIWAAGGLYSGWLTAASAVRVKAGGNAADTADGNGARSIVVEGLDETWALASETLVTAGASASAASSTTFIRVFRSYVGGAGAYGGANTGTVDIETTGGALVSRVPTGSDSGNVGLGQSLQAMYTVPAGYRAYVRRVSAAIEGNKEATVYYFQRQNADDTSAPYTPKRVWWVLAGIAGRAANNFESFAGPFPARTDLWASAVGPTGAGGVTAEFDLVLIEEP